MLSIEPQVLDIHEDEGTVCIVSVYYYGDFYLISWDKVLEEASMAGTISTARKINQHDMDNMADLCKDFFDSKDY